MLVSGDKAGLVVVVVVVVVEVDSFWAGAMMGIGGVTSVLCFGGGSVKQKRGVVESGVFEVVFLGQKLSLCAGREG